MNKDKFFVWCMVKRHLGKMSIKHTRIRYDYLFRYLGRKRLNQNTAEQFILHLREKGLRNASINSYIRVINLIDIFERENNKDLNLLKKISYFPKQRKVPTFLSFEEIEAILATKLEFTKQILGKSPQIDEIYRLATFLIAGTGCRFSEMANLKKENLYLGISEGYVEFKDTKTMEDRKVPIPPILVGLLKDLVKNKSPKQLVFTSFTDHILTEQSFSPILRRRAEKACIEKHIYPHCFRNSYIREHRRAGTDILTLAKLVGHRDPKTTLGYDQFEYDDLLKGAENHPLFARSISTSKLLQKYAETVNKWGIMQDYRFSKRVELRENSLLIELYLK